MAGDFMVVLVDPDVGRVPLVITAPVQHSDPRWGLNRLRAPGVVLGIGLGGFFDGIVFHQILQLHHMLSNAGNDQIGLDPTPVTTVAGLEANTLWDGLFHVATYLAVLIGLVWLWRRWDTVQPVWAPTKFLVGCLMFGWGLFNVVEGIINHHILQIHHVVAGDWQVIWDLVFLAAGTVFIVGGARLMQNAESDTTRRRRSP